MFKKLIAMALSVSMVLTCALVAGAASTPEQSVNGDGSVVYEYGDIRITITETDGVKTRGSATGSGIANPRGGVHFDLVKGEGNACYAGVDNTHDEADMTVVVTYDGANEEDYAELNPFYVEAGKGCVATITSNSGADLEGRLSLSIKAENADSVTYEYYVEQYSK